MDRQPASATSLASADLEPPGDVGEHPGDRQLGAIVGPAVEGEPSGLLGGALALSIREHSGVAAGPAELLGQLWKHPIEAQARA